VVRFSAAPLVITVRIAASFKEGMIESELKKNARGF
jgi:hypothetical protein